MRRPKWNYLVENIKRHRASSALFFKPVCVIAAIDLADEGEIDPDNIAAQKILERFSEYVTPFHPNRGKDGFKPLWHLSNDGLWTFFNRGEPMTTKMFPQGAPATMAKLFSRFDRLAINKDLRKLWGSRGERSTLRDSMFLILDASDADSRRLIAPLYKPNHLSHRDRWPSDSELSDYFRALRDQQSLFDAEFIDSWPRDYSASNVSKNLDAHDPSSVPPTPDAVENVSSPIDYVWSDGKLVVGPNSANVPIFPYASAEHDHAQRLEACSFQARDLIQDFGRRNWNIREDYQIELTRYLDRLPSRNGPGNILLADSSARILREMFAAEASDFLPPGFAARLKTLLQNHIALRPFYPELENYYRAVTSGRIDAPLPLDAVSEVINVVRDQTPTVFGESVPNAIDDARSLEPRISAAKHNQSKDENILPPPDPLGELDPTKARDFQTAGWINRLWKVFKMGATVNENMDAWVATYNSLSSFIKPVLDWLKQFLDR